MYTAAGIIANPSINPGGLHLLMRTRLMLPATRAVDPWFPSASNQGALRLCYAYFLSCQDSSS